MEDTHIKFQGFEAHVQSNQSDVQGFETDFQGLEFGQKFEY